LISKRWLRIGVGFLATIVATVIIVRLFSIAIDGATPESLRLFVPESILFAFSLGGLWLESVRPKHSSSGSALQ
jgi:hypothetical protein